MRQILLLEPAARTSNEHETWRAIPNARLVVVSDRSGWDADETIVLPARRLPVVGRHEWWTAALAWLKDLDQIDVGPVDVVVSVELFSPLSVQAGHLARRLGAAHVVSIAETLADGPVYRYPPYRQMARRVAGRADGFVCLTAKAREAAITLGCPADRCFVVSPGVDTTVFHPAVRLEEDPRVLFIGMLRADRGADKGLLDIVEACARLRETHPGLELTVVGEGPLGSVLEDGADRWPFVRLLGRRPRSELPELLRAARCLVLASKRTWKWEEQFGYVLAEAMATGLPVVGTRSGAIPEVVGPENLLADPGDRPGLARAIGTTLGERGAEYGRHNRRQAVERFDLERQGARLDEVLSAMVKRER